MNNKDIFERAIGRVGDVLEDELCGVGEGESGFGEKNHVVREGWR